MKISRRAISASFVGVTTIAALVFMPPTSSLTNRLPKTAKSHLAAKPLSLTPPAMPEKHQVTESLIFNANHGQSVASLAELLLKVRQAVEAKQYDAGAVYQVTIDPTLTQQAYLKASNTESADFFGYSVAISGDTAVVGAYAEASNATGVNGNQSYNSQPESGAVYVFVRSGETWIQQAYLKASNNDGPFGPNVGDRFGHVVAISGDTIIVGAPYEDSNATGVNGDQNNSLAQNSGAAYVFVRISGAWSQQAYLKASNTEQHDAFGQTVAVSGDTVIVGAPGEDSDALGVNGNQGNNSRSDSGAGYVFARTGGTWSQQAYLKASNADRMDYFGRSVAISGDSVVVGARNESSNATGVDGDQSNNLASASGAAYVFARSGTVWSQEAYLKASNTGPVDFFGESVAISGDTIVVGAADEDSNATGVNANQSDNSASAAGAAYVFGRTAGVWSQQAYLKASNSQADDAFGGQVAVSGNVVVVGARFEDSSATGVDGNQNSNSASQSGAAYLFARSGGAWSQQAYLKASNTDPLRNDLFGESVAISDATIMVGAAYEGSNATGVNGDQTNNSAAASGAVYVYAPLTIAKVAQSISFPPIGNRTYGDTPFALSATASSGLPVSFSVLSGPVTLAGNTLTITGVGNVTVRASQNGDANYEAAADVTQTFTIQLGQPVLTRNNVLIVPPAGSGTITSNHLQVVSAGIPASQIVYTLVSPLPAKGQVKRNGTLLGWLLNPSTGHYYTSTAPGHRGATAAEAASYGAFLTTINNAAENVWITNNFSRVVQAYNGLNDPGGWDNGESSAYRNWYPGEPNSGQETAVHMYLNAPDGEGAQWNDIDPNQPVHPGIVEKNNSSGILLSFTQADIDEGRVTYHHFAASLATTPVDPDDFTFTVSDGAGGNISNTIFQIMVDSTAPAADIVDVTPDPRAVSVATITMGFTEAVNAFDLQDLQLRRDGGGNLLTAAQTLTTSDNITWTLGNLSELTGAPGSYTLTLTAAGSGITDAFGTALAGDSSDTWVVFGPAPQTITFGALANKTFGDVAFPVNATASSGLPVGFSIVSGPATITGNTVTITGAGTVVVRASQGGNLSYNPATPVDQSFIVSKATASIALSGLNQSYDGTAKTATTTTLPAGLAVSLVYSQGGAPMASPINAGSYDIVATVNDANYQGNTVGVLTIDQAAQTITFGSLPNKTFGDAPFAVNATASSGLVVTFSIVSGPATIFGNTVTIIGIGPVLVRASQAGNLNYNAATLVDQSFIVDDTTAPVPDVGSLPTVSGDCSASITSPPTATDNFAGPIVGTTTDPTSYTTQGTFVVNWNYNDGNGNTSTQTQTVIVHDTTAPVPNVASLPTVTGECLATVTAPTATDTCAGTITGTTTDPTNYNSQGTFTIHWAYNDGNGNSSTQTQTVIVHDTSLPTISAPADLTAYTGPGAVSCGVVIADAALGIANASDNCGAVTVSRAGVPAGNIFPLGMTAITYTATDALGNTASATQTVTVVDNTPPVISCPANVTVTADLGSTSAVATYSAPAATENCGVPIVSCSITSGSSFAIGTTTVSCTATDNSNNADSCAITITVLTPQSTTQELVNNVDNLVSGGILNQGNGNALIAKLEAAIDSMNSGNTTAACNQLQAFISQTEAFINSGKLTPAQGQPLIDVANALKAVLGC